MLVLRKTTVPVSPFLLSTKPLNEHMVRTFSHLPLAPQLQLILSVRKLDFYLLPFLSLMYFFNSVDRSNLGNAKTDGMDIDLGFTGEQYSLLILLFYIPNGLCDLPLNMLTKKWSGRTMLPTCKSHPHFRLCLGREDDGTRDGIDGS